MTKNYFYLLILFFLIFTSFTIRVEAALWTPAQISTTAWYDASDASTITASTTDISQWRSKSGSNL